MCLQTAARGPRTDSRGPSGCVRRQADTFLNQTYSIKIAQSFWQLGKLLIVTVPRAVRAPTHKIVVALCHNHFESPCARRQFNWLFVYFWKHKLMMFVKLKVGPIANPVEWAWYLCWVTWQGKGISSDPFGFPSHYYPSDAPQSFMWLWQRR